MSTSNWMAVGGDAKDNLSQSSGKPSGSCRLQRILKFVYGNWKHSIAGILAAAALVGEVYIAVQVKQEGKAVCSGINGESAGGRHHSYFFWLALGIMVACSNNLVIAGLATFKNVYLKNNREKNTRWLWPLFAAYVCMMGLMAGILPAALRPHDGPSLFAIISILSVYFQSILWAIILGWRDVKDAYEGPGISAPAPPPPPTTIVTKPPTVTRPQQQPSQFPPML